MVIKYLNISQRLYQPRVSQPVENRDIEKILINNIVSRVIINTRDKRTQYIIIYLVT